MTVPRGVDTGMLTLRQAAEQTGLSATTLRRYIKSGRLRARLVPGRYGPEYVVTEEDLAAAGVPRESALQRREPAPAGRVRDGGPPSSVAEPLPAGADLVPGLLYRELLMKHEQLLVRYGMLQVSGRQLYEIREQAERRAAEARRAARELRKVQERHAKEIGRLRASLRQAELRLAEREETIRELNRQVRRLEIALRNARTARAFDEEFRRALRRIERPAPPPPAGAAPRPHAP